MPTHPELRTRPRKEKSCWNLLQDNPLKYSKYSYVYEFWKFVIPYTLCSCCTISTDIKIWITNKVEVFYRIVFSEMSCEVLDELFWMIRWLSAADSSWLHLLFDSMFTPHVCIFPPSAELLFCCMWWCCVSVICLSQNMCLNIKGWMSSCVSVSPAGLTADAGLWPRCLPPDMAPTLPAPLFR